MLWCDTVHSLVRLTVSLSVIPSLFECDRQAAFGQRDVRRPYLGQSKSAIAGPPSVRHGRACGTATTWYQGLPAVLVGQVREAPKGSSPRLRTARRHPWQRRGVTTP